MTNTRLSDATPAALYAHTAARQWECEKEMPSDRPESVKDITWQLVNNDPGMSKALVSNSAFTAFMGGRGEQKPSGLRHCFKVE